MTRTHVLEFALFAVAALVSRPSYATSELHKNVSIALVGEIIIGSSNPNSDYTFDILWTDPTAMSAIIDVFSYPDRALLGQGIPHTDPGIGDFTAHVHLPVGAHNGKMYVIVRPMDTAQASVTLRVTRSLTEPPYAVGTSDFPMSISGQGASGSGRILVAGGLVAGTEVRTTEEAETTAQEASKNDTILMVLENDIPIAFDDDMGVGRMSWLSLSAPCRPEPVRTCEIFVAARGNDKRRQSPSQPGYEVPLPLVGGFHATVQWDEDVGNGKDLELDAFGNPTGDGLGEMLEVFLGTCPDPATRTQDRDGDGIPDCDDPDVDGDGLSDGVEVIGVADAPTNQENQKSLVRMPYYGAAPLQPDLFVEMDWAPYCMGNNPNTCPPTLKETLRFTQVQEVELASILPPEIAVHIDGGHPDPSRGTTTGDWGGAEMVPDADTATLGACTGMSPERAGLFAHLMACANNPPQNWGRCSFVHHGRVSASAHEMGHYFGLQHWGDPADHPTRDVNCKYNYLSIMNYNFADMAGAPGSTAWFGNGSSQISPFSRAAFSGLMLNDYSINELAGLGGAASASVLSFFNQVLGFKIDPVNGYVDWNRNGKFDAGLTRGMLNTPLFNGGDCDLGAPSQRRDSGFAPFGLPSLATDSGVLEIAGLAPVGTPLAGGGVSSTVGILLGVQPSLNACDTTQGKNACATWPAAFTQAFVNPIPEPGLFAPAVAGGIVVYADGFGSLYFFDKPTAVPGATVAPTRVGGPPINGDPIAVVRPSGVVSVYAPSGGFLLRWDYDPGQNAWTLIADTQFWANTSPHAPITTNVGIGLTWGYQQSLPNEPSYPNENLYAAVLTQDPSGNARIALARVDGGETATTLPGTSIPVYLFPSDWVELPSSDTGFSVPGTLDQSRLGLAFRPEDPAAPAPKPGRFYLTWQQWRDSSPPGMCWPIYPHLPMMNFTMGNLYSATTPLAGQEQPLRFLNAVMLGNEWTSYADGNAIVYYDGAIRGVSQTHPTTEYDILRDASGNPIMNPNGTCKYATPIVLPTLANPQLTFYPNIDGIFNLDQLDFDDVTWMKSHLAWALKQQ